MPLVAKGRVGLPNTPVSSDNTAGVPDPEGILAQQPLPPPPTVNVSGTVDSAGIFPPPQTAEEWRSAVQAHGVDTTTGGGFGVRTALGFIPDDHHAGYLQKQYGAENVIKVGPEPDDLAYREAPDKPFVAVKPGDRPWYEPSLGSVGARIGELPTAVGGIAGGVLGGVPGAFFGAAVGEGLKEDVRREFNLPGQQTPGETGQKMLATGATQAAFEGVGRYALGPAVKGITEEAKGALSEVEHLLPSQFQAAGSVGQKVLGFIEKISDIGPWKAAGKLRGAQQTFMENWAKELETRVDVGELGEVTLDLASKTSTIARNTVNSLFRDVDDEFYKTLSTVKAAQGAGAVSLEALKHRASEALAKATGGSLSKEATELYQRVAQLDDTASFVEANVLLDDLTHLIRTRGPGAGEAISLAATVRNQMEQAGASLKGAAKNLFGMAWPTRDAVDNLGIRALQKLSGKIADNPEAVVPHLLTADATVAERLISQLDDRTAAALQQGTLAHVMEQARAMTGTDFLPAIEKQWGQIPADLRQAIFSGETGQEVGTSMESFIRTAKVVGLQRNPVGSRAAELGKSGITISAGLKDIGKVLRGGVPLHLLTHGLHVAGSLETVGLTLSPVVVAKLLMTPLEH